MLMRPKAIATMVVVDAFTLVLVLVIGHRMSIGGADCHLTELRGVS